MAATEPSTLSDALTGEGSYPTDHPQTLADLVAADPDTLQHPLAWFLRKQAIAAIRAWERHDVRTPGDVLELLLNGYLHPMEGAWVSYALSGDRQVVLAPNGKGGMRSLRKATALLPKKEDLPDIPASAWRGGKKPVWLVLYGGDPGVLEKEHVARGLATLQRKVPVADICFFQRDPISGVLPTMWSVRAGVGLTAARDLVPFPNPTTVEEVRNYERDQREHRPAS